MTLEPKRIIPTPAPRKSGLTRLQLALLGKGPVAAHVVAARRAARRSS